MAEHNNGFLVFKQAFARERLTVGNTVQTLTEATYIDAAAAADNRRRASGAKITIETAAIRYTEEGTAPTSVTGAGSGANLGHVAAANDIIYLDGLNALRNFKAIRDTAGNATIEVTYYR